MYKRAYKVRKQVEHRRKYGRVERRKELIERLAKIKQQKREIKMAEEEIRNKSGQEYFFAYNSIQHEDGKVYKIEHPSVDELRRMKVYIDNEMARYERKMQKFMARPANEHIRFDGKEEARDELFDYDKNERERSECREYIDALKQKRAEVFVMLEDIRK
jgi:U3 small nucleolar RNA-associated protein 11